ncbi:MAG TPA: hypothetical protein VLA19_03640 [Herpetosiphonaceae bacterium]|nr:hypothetical protein [Herpetosiphonaceae bacterium]
MQLQQYPTYQHAPEERRRASFEALSLEPVVLTPSKRYVRRGAREREPTS